MKALTLALTLTLSLGVLYSGLGNAALISRLGGQAVYDEDLNITWLSDANLALTNQFGLSLTTTGRMTWGNANAWIAGMNADGGTGYLGYSDWRLPTTVVPDSGCTDLDGVPRADSRGYNCTGSEMGHLFYNELGGTAGSSILSSLDPDLDKFSNVQSNNYWSGTEFAPGSSSAWDFFFNVGVQGTAGLNGNFFAWAVRSGDVEDASAPEPATLLLFSLGLLGLGLGRRKAAAT